MSGKVLLLGKGFIGTQLARALNAAGYSVQSYASSECDLRHPERVSETLGPLDENDTLILSAARTRTAQGEGSVYADNVAIARSVAAFLHTHPIRQVIFFSTADVYGPPAPNQHLRESLALNPMGSYARSKAVSESILQYVCSPYETRLMVLRFPGVYGPGDHGHSVIGRMLRDGRNQRVITLKGSGSVRRDYLFVDDLIEVVKHTLEFPRHATVNVATGRSQAIADIAQYIAGQIGPDVKIHNQAAAHSVRDYHLDFDVARLRAMFPSIQWTSLEQGVLRLNPK